MHLRMRLAEVNTLVEERVVGRSKHKKAQTIAGIEAGRGCSAGRLAAKAVLSKAR
jgi:hypothetical protein